MKSSYFTNPLFTHQINDELSSENDEFVTIDDVFFKPNSKIESARYTVHSYIKNQKTAAQALNEIAKHMIWELDFEPVSAINYRYGMAVLIDGIEFTIGEGDNKKEAKQNASAEAINAIKMKLKKPKDDVKPPAAVDMVVMEPIAVATGSWRCRCSVEWVFMAFL